MVWMITKDVIAAPGARLRGVGRYEANTLATVCTLRFVIRNAQGKVCYQGVASEETREIVTLAQCFIGTAVISYEKAVSQ